MLPLATGPSAGVRRAHLWTSRRARASPCSARRAPANRRSPRSRSSSPRRKQGACCLAAPTSPLCRRPRCASADRLAQPSHAPVRRYHPQQPAARPPRRRRRRALGRARRGARRRLRSRSLPDGLDTWVGEGGARLSGGQGRRLALARALLSPAPILILDEPCAGLDAETERAFLATLNEVALDARSC